ncbi:fungal specific transcription factor domain-containing protein [Colletotrichum tofieldiae]|uniref:Fungal specific transcription factor domain-containing protein n=1 Tax=Colletotrichum tofieldiae TaxID=708197 RepID=A0A161W3P3_9PEZI|nr:fungal specific transcription factor domain-containing protein [Colletotrichum tofieldiae]
MSTYTNPVSTPTGSHIESEGTTARRRRINFACNYCRNRKTRCDEQKPSCRACIAAGIECVTTDRRRPGVEVQRRETKRRMSRASTSSLTHSLTTNTSPHSPRDIGTAEPAEGPAEISPLGNLHSIDGRGPTARVATLTSEPIAVIHEGEESSTSQPPAKYQGKLPVVRPSRGSSSIEILGDWLDLAARRLGIQQRRGLPSRPEKPPSHRIRALLSPEPLPLPPKDTAQQLASRFLDGVNLVYPIVNRDCLRQDLDAASEHGPVSFAEGRGIAALSTVYLVLSIGFASESLSDIPSDARDYMLYCKTLLGHLVMNNSVDTVRAIVLLALCLHCYDNCAGAWNTLGVGVSMAVSLGLHKPRTCQGCRRGRPNTRADFVDDKERRNFWLGIYAFEKFLAFEMGRLSSIDDEDCYPPHVDMPTGNGTSSKGKAFPVTVDLARILSDIGRKAVIVSRKEDGLRDGALQAVIAEKIQTTGEAQLSLTRWGESVPDELRPISDILNGSKICPFAAFISMHYNNALVILSRNSLLISEEAIATGANIIAKGKPWDFMMRNGQSLAANSARKVLRIVVEAVDSKANAILPNLLAPLHALSTLAVHVITHPDSRISTMDLHLIQTSSDSMREIYARIRGDGLLDSLLQKLDALLQKGLPPPGGVDFQRLDGITTNNPRLEANPWENSGETSSHRTPEAGWAGNGESRPQETDCHPPNPTTPFFSQGNAVTGANDFGFDSFGTMTLAGDEWSPSVSDGTGWDWACFSQLLSE